MRFCGTNPNWARSPRSPNIYLVKLITHLLIFDTKIYLFVVLKKLALK